MPTWQFIRCLLDLHSPSGAGVIPHAAAGFAGLAAAFCLGAFAAFFFGDDLAVAAAFALLAGLPVLDAAGFAFLGDLAAAAGFAFAGDLTFCAGFALAVVFLVLAGDFTFSADLALGLLAFGLVMPA